MYQFTYKDTSSVCPGRDCSDTIYDRPATLDKRFNPIARLSETLAMRTTFSGYKTGTSEIEIIL